MYHSSLENNAKNKDSILFIKSLLENQSISWDVVKNAILLLRKANKLDLSKANNKLSNDANHLFILLSARLLKPRKTKAYIDTGNIYYNSDNDSFKNKWDGEDIVNFLLSTFGKKTLCSVHPNIYSFSDNHVNKRKPVSLVHAIFYDAVEAYSQKTKGLYKWMNIDKNTTFSWNVKFDDFNKNIIDIIFYDTSTRKNNIHLYPKDELDYLCNMEIDLTKNASNGTPLSKMFTQKNQWKLFLKQGGNVNQQVSLNHNDMNQLLEDVSNNELWWYLLQLNKSNTDNEYCNISQIIEEWIKDKNNNKFEEKQKEKYFSKLKNKVQYYCTMDDIKKAVKKREDWTTIKDKNGANTLMLCISAHESAYKVFSLKKAQHMWGEFDKQGNNVFVYALSNVQKISSDNWKNYINHPEVFYKDKNHSSGNLEKIIQNYNSKLELSNEVSVKEFNKALRKTSINDWFAIINKESPALFIEMFKKGRGGSSTFISKLMVSLADTFKDDIKNDIKNNKKITIINKEWLGVLSLFCASYVGKQSPHRGLGGLDTEKKYNDLSIEFIEMGGILPKMSNETTEKWKDKIEPEFLLKLQALSNKNKINDRLKDVNSLNNNNEYGSKIKPKKLKF